MTDSPTVSWTLPETLPSPKSNAVYHLQQQELLEANLSLAASKRQIESSAAQLGIDKVESWLGEISFDGEAEHTDTQWEYTRGIGFQLPLFDWGRGARQAHQAEF